MVFRQEEWSVGDDPLYLKLWPNWPLIFNRFSLVAPQL